MPICRDFIYVDMPVQLKWVTSADMSNVTAVKIKYTKPSGATGFVTLSAGSPAGTYTGLFPSADNDETGEWIFRAWLTVNYDANPIPGRIFRVIVHAENEEP